MRRLLVLLSFLFPSCLCFAGHYEAETSKELTLTSVNGIEQYVEGPGAVHASIGNATGMGGGSGSISGTVTTVFRWVPRQIAGGEDPLDSPPDSVIVIESSSVESMAGAYPGSGSASASNGLGTLPIGGTVRQLVPVPFPPYIIDLGSITIWRSVGERARVVQGGETITISNAIAASAATPNGPFGITVGYEVSAHPVIITASTPTAGSASDPGTFCEVGRGYSASISTTAPEVLFTAHSWEVAGKTYKNYFVVSDSSSADVTEMSPSDWSQANPKWRWREPEENSTLKCSAAVLYRGTFIGSCSAKLIVTVESPFAIMTIETSGMSITRRVVDGFTYRGVYSAGNPDFDENLGPIGMKADLIGSSSPHFSGGKVFYAQLVNYAWTNNLAVPVINSDGEYELDYSYPYQPYSVGSTYGVLELPNYDTELGEAVISDTPEFMFLLNTRTWVEVDTVFDSFLMYRPLGADCSDVPLAIGSWSWQAHSEGPNPVSGTPKAGSVVPKGTRHPVWEKKATLPGMND